MRALLSISPVLVVLGIMLFSNLSTSMAALLGLLSAVAISLTFFETSLEVVLRSCLAGFVAAFPVSLIVPASLFQLSIMERSGAINKAVELMKESLSDRPASRIVALVIGVGTILASVGAVPVTVLTPILMAFGYDSRISIALSALGYDSLCTYSILGVPLVVFCDMVGLDLIDGAKYFLPYVPVVSCLITLAVLFTAHGRKFAFKYFHLSLLVGVLSYLGAVIAIYIKTPVLTGLIVGALIVLILSFSRNRKSIEEESLGSFKDFLHAFFPWIVLIFFISFSNLFEPIRKLAYDKLSFPVYFFGLSLKPVQMRLLWQAYTWIFVSSLISIFFYKLNGKEVSMTLRKTFKRSWQPFWSASFFFMTAYVMLYSGFVKTSGSFQLLNEEMNMINALTEHSARLFKGLFPFLTPFIGVFGGFITGTQTSATAMFTVYTLKTSHTLNLSPFMMAAAVSFGSGLASAISPSKLQNAAASIDRVGEEKRVIRMMIPVILVLTALTSIVSYLFRNTILP
jgi:lactate permease